MVQHGWAVHARVWIWFEFALRLARTAFQPCPRAAVDGSYRYSGEILQLSWFWEASVLMLVGGSVGEIVVVSSFLFGGAFPVDPKLPQALQARQPNCQVTFADKRWDSLPSVGLMR